MSSYTITISHSAIPCRDISHNKGEYFGKGINQKYIMPWESDISLGIAGSSHFEKWLGKGFGLGLGLGPSAVVVVVAVDRWPDCLGSPGLG